MTSSLAEKAWDVEMSCLSARDVPVDPGGLRGVLQLQMCAKLAIHIYGA